MSTISSSRSTTALRVLAWGSTFAAFPLGGLLASAIVGPVDSVGAALVGGAIVGATVGSAQALGSRAIAPDRPLKVGRWALLTATGMGAGLALGAATVGFATSLADLVLMGTITGAILGPIQAAGLPYALAPELPARLLWALSTPAVLAIGWTVTTLAGVDVSQRFAVFGATGAIVATALIGCFLHLLALHARGSLARKTARR